MIVDKHPGIVSLLITMRGSIVPKILPQIIGVAAFACLIVYLHRQHGFEPPEFSLTAFALLGVALSLFLGFRNNAAYDRWWEGRKLWGKLVHETRAIARASMIFLPGVSPRRIFLKKIAAFSHALRHGLICESEAGAAMEPLIGEELTRRALSSTNPADALLRDASAIIAQQWGDGRIDSIGAQTLNQHLSQIGKHQAGLERLASTPLPFAYSLLVHRTAYVYCLLLPFGLLDAVQWWAPMFTALVAYCFFGLDALSQQLERPFSRSGLNHLPMEALCRINEISIAEALGEPPPKALTAVRGVID